ncbi:MAG: DUF4325 domain-containing protein [Lysobacterales bacterium]|jgi:anti-sigma regulatory factor (Ser/Thr protein kinase)
MANTREIIERIIADNGSATAVGLADRLGITRQAVNAHLRLLIGEGKVIKTGSTRAARYFPASDAPDAQKISWRLDLRNIDESVIYDRLSIHLNLSRLSRNVESIVHYAFTEILNNAIDHSMSEKCRVEASIDAAKMTFDVRDEGIGAFQSITDKLGLHDEHEALVELIKGKTTTMPEAHSGEGIFFVSRAADRFRLRSHRQQIEWDRAKDDVFVSSPRFIRGTLAQFQISIHSRTRLENIFAEFSPEKYDYQFQKTRVMVKLLQKDYVSRSEAKRLLHNLEKFSEIEVDMRDVQNVGQGFADEIFRVFTNAHPGIEIRAINASGAVEAMLRHAGASG